MGAVSQRFRTVSRHSRAETADRQFCKYLEYLVFLASSQIAQQARRHRELRQRQAAARDLRGSRRGCARPQPCAARPRLRPPPAPAAPVCHHRRGQPALGVADRVERAVEREAVEIIGDHDARAPRSRAGRAGRTPRRRNRSRRSRRSASGCGRRSAPCRALRRVPASSAMRRASASGTPAILELLVARAPRRGIASCGSAVSSAAATAAMPSR